MFSFADTMKSLMVLTLGFLSVNPRNLYRSQALSRTFCIVSSNASCSVIDSTYGVASCTSSARDGDATISVDYELLKPLNSIFINIEAYGVMFGNKFLIMNKTLDACKFFRGERSGINAISYSLQYIKKWKTLPKTCPILPGHYHVSNATIEDGGLKTLVSGSVQSHIVLQTIEEGRMHPVFFFDNAITLKTKRKRERC